MYFGAPVPDPVTVLTLTFNSEQLHVYTSDFWTEVQEIITKLRPVVVAVAGQAISNNAFYSKMHELLDTFEENISNTGRASSYSLFSNINRKALKLMIYVRDDNYIYYSKPAAGNYFENVALASYLTLPNQTRLAFMNIHLPLDKKSVKESLEKEDPYIRANALAEQNVLLNQAYRKLVLDFAPDYAIVMGDLNYQMTPRNWDPYQTAQYVLNNPEDRTGDELHTKMQTSNIYPLQEATITFAPTCNLQINPLVPSYCTRILYQNYRNDTQMHAFIYDQFKHQFGVWSYFEFL